MLSAMYHNLMVKLHQPETSLRWEPMGEGGLMVVECDGVAIANPRAITVERLVEWGYLRRVHRAEEVSYLVTPKWLQEMGSPS